MGIDQYIAQFCLRKVHYISLERAFNYLYTKDENQKFRHTYIELKSDVCFLCNENEICHDQSTVNEDVIYNSDEGLIADIVDISPLQAAVNSFNETVKRMNM